MIDKNFSHNIEQVRRQYSGNAHGVIQGIGVVTCVYVNPQTDQFWMIDYRIYLPDGEGKTKLEHRPDRLMNCVYQKNLEFWSVLMDKPVCNQRNDAVGSKPYQRVDSLEWTKEEEQQGEVIKIKGFPAEHKVKVFRGVLSAFGAAHGLCRYK